MTKGVSEKFDEHEQDTARRAYPQEIVDGTKRTTKMTRIDAPELRTESGTRPVLTHEMIERHVRENSPPSRSTPTPFEDPHARPTIEHGFIDLPPESHQPSGWATTTPVPPSEPALGWHTSRPSSAQQDFPQPPPRANAIPIRRTPIAGWVVACIVAGLVFMIAAAGAVGFVLGHRSR